ncbi:hypothetical protein ACSQ67_018885 [Phaseolus vulgaris]
MCVWVSVPLTDKLANPVTDLLYTNSPPTRERDILIPESNPKAEEKLVELLEDENFYLNIERTRTVAGVDFEVEGKR